MGTYADGKTQKRKSRPAPSRRANGQTKRKGDKCLHDDILLAYARVKLCLSKRRYLDETRIAPLFAPRRLRCSVHNAVMRFCQSERGSARAAVSRWHR